MDQGLTSGAGFLLNLFLARWLDSEAYGAFAVAFATLLFLSGFHSALLLEPMSVVGPANYSRQITGYCQTQLKLHWALTAFLSSALLIAALVAAAAGVHREVPLAIAGSALALPFLLLLWMVRRMCYVVHRPAMAVWGSVGYLGVVLIGLLVLHSTKWLSPLSAFLLMGVAGASAAPLLLRRLLVAEQKSIPLSPWDQVLRENWKYGRWVVASTILFAVATQTQTYMAAALLGLGAAGILRAVQIPSLLMTQIVTAAGLLVLPAMSREFGLGRIDRLKKQAVFTALLLTGGSLAYVAFLGAFAKTVEHLLFGGKFSSHAWLIPTFGFVPVITGLATGFSMALRASQRPHFDLLAYAVSGPVGLITAIIFIRAWGLGGAAWSLLAGFAAYALVLLWSFKTWTRKGAVTRDLSTS